MIIKKHRRNRNGGNCLSKQLILSLAMSLDGFIADDEGGYDWIHGDGQHHLDTTLRWDYDAFLQGIDTVIMGRACYDQKMHLDFAGKQVLVATSHPPLKADDVRFITGDLCGTVRAEKAKQGKDIFLFGGGKAAAPLIEADLVDRYIIGIIPVLLGYGRPLFYPRPASAPLTLDRYMIEEGVVVLDYLRRPVTQAN